MTVMARALVVVVVLAMAPAAGAGGGWYLMFPPNSPAGYPNMNREAPLSRWRQAPHAFDTATECNRFRLAGIALADKRIAEETTSPELITDALLTHIVAEASHCVAADDPRLVPR